MNGRGLRVVVSIKIHSERIDIFGEKVTNFSCPFVPYLYSVEMIHDSTTLLGRKNTKKYIIISYIVNAPQKNENSIRSSYKLKFKSASKHEHSFPEKIFVNKRAEQLNI